MARTKSEILITQSLIDRLVDHGQWPETRAASISMYRESIKRDLEWLLNTRQPPLPQLGGRTTAAKTVINYGLPDISSLGMSNAADHRALRLAIEECLHNFEPRLMDIRVTLQGSDTADRRLRFHIEGNMKLDPAPEEISFDTVLELSSGEYKVK